MAELGTQNTWSGRIKNKQKLKENFSRLYCHCHASSERFINYFLINFISIDREMFALYRKKRIISLRCIKLELSMKY